MNRPVFLQKIAPVLFGGQLSTGQLAGINQILDYYLAHYAFSPSYLAYVLATAFHETGHLMQPVREGFAQTDAGAVLAVTRLFLAKKIKTNYALPTKAGKSYFGRGIVQLTWEDNYLRVGRLLGIDLWGHPELALDPQISVKILVEGMVHGWYSGPRLAQFISETKRDYVGARAIVNGHDKADEIAEHAKKFYAALYLAQDPLPGVAAVAPAGAPLKVAKKLAV